MVMCLWNLLESYLVLRIFFFVFSLGFYVLGLNEMKYLKSDLCSWGIV